MEQRIEALLAQCDAQCILITSYANRRYYSGFSGSSGILVIAPDLRILITDSRYTTQAQRQAPHFNVVEASDFPAKLGEILQTKPMETIAFEAEDLSWGSYQKFARALTAKLVPLEDLAKLRAVKSSLEIERITRAAQITDEALGRLLGMLKVGMTEFEAVAEFEYQLRQLGADLAFPTIVASGHNSALPHAQPGERRFAPGDFVVIDCGASWQGYCSDMTRTVVVGQEPTVQMREIYQLVLQAQLAGIAAVRPQIGCRELDSLVRSIIEEGGYGYAFGHGLGHGVGLEIHEEPRLSPKGEGQLAPGMIITVEPGIYLPHCFGVRIEDLLVVGPRGAQVLSGTTKELLCVG